MPLGPVSFGVADLLPREAARRRVRAALMDLRQVEESSLMRNALAAEEWESMRAVLCRLAALSVMLER